MEHRTVDFIWIIITGTLVFSMQAGFAMVESGLTRSKNSINVAIKNLTDFGISLALFWIIGFALMFGPSVAGLFGFSDVAPNLQDPWEAAFFFFQAMFCSTSATIVSGAVAERMRFASYLVGTMLLSGLLYPFVGHWAWGGALGGEKGWLAAKGFVDFAGSTVVHSLGAWVALAALLVLGPRLGRFSQDGSVNPINGSSIPQAVLGVMLLWFGWIGFNGGSTLTLSPAVAGIILRTMLAGAAGMLATLAVGWILYKKPEVSLVLNGSLAGLVAVTAGAHALDERAAVLVGAIGGLVMLGGAFLLRRLRIDDAVDAIPVHLFAGAWGTLAVGLFGRPELLNTGLPRISQIIVQAEGITVTGLFVFPVSLVFFTLYNRVAPIRVSQDDETAGLNMAEHGVSTEINSLFITMDQQARTGDLSLRAPVEPFTEAGQIAGMYNTVLDKLQNSTIEKGEYLNILQNITDGLFLLDKNRRLGRYHSQSLHQLFDREQLSGISLDEATASFMDGETRQLMQEFLDVAFDASVPWRQVERCNPLKEVRIHFDDRTGSFTERIYDFQFTRIENPDGSIERLMVVVRDLTDKIHLEEQLEKDRENNRREIELLQKMLHIDPITLKTFIGSAKEHIENINEELRNPRPNAKERLELIYCYSHSIKGDAELIGLEHLGQKAEELEQLVPKLEQAETLNPEAFLPMVLACSELMEMITTMEQMIDKWQSHSAAIQKVMTGSAPKHSSSLEELARMAERLAARYTKEVRLLYDSFNMTILHSSRGKHIIDIIVQFIRNSVYHGVELPDERVKNGKPRHGSIILKSEQLPGKIRLIYRDDGRGLYPDVIATAAVKKGLISASEAARIGPREAAELMFRPGFSSADHPDRVAGKGVGMTLVRRRIKELGATLRIGTVPGKYLEFTIDIPESEEFLDA
jgi:Amt family ammonium transporter